MDDQSKQALLQRKQLLLRKKELLEQRAQIAPEEKTDVLKDGLKMGMDVIGDAAQRTIRSGPGSFNNLTGGVATEFLHNAKSSGMERAGIDPVIAESISSATDPQSMLGGLRGDVGKLVGKLVPQPIKNTTTGRTAFVERVRGGFQGAKRKAGEQFEGTLTKLTTENPDRFVDLSAAVAELGEDIKLNPKLLSAVNRSPRLQAILQDPSKAAKLTLTEAQELKNEMTSKLSLGKLQGNNVRTDDLPLFDTVDNIREAQLSAFPDEQFGEFAKARKDYGRTMSDYRMVKPRIQPGRTEENIYKNFGGDAEIQDAVKRLLPKELQKEIGRTKVVRKTGKVAGVAGGLALGGGLIEKLYKRISGQG